MQIPVRDDRIPHLAGTLWHPTGSDATPGVVLVQGSGPTDRDWNNPLVPGEIGSGRRLAQHLAAAGFAVLAFDKRGVGASPADPKLSEAALMSDLAAAFEFLQAHPRTGHCAVGIVGHSQGAALALGVARSRTDVAALALLAGSGRSTRALIREQVAKNLLAPAGLSPSAIATNLAHLDRALDAIAEGHAVPPAREEIHAEVAALGVAFESAGSVLRAGLDRDPTEWLAEVRSPTLIIGGGKDVQVRRIDFDALTAARPDATALFVPDMDHVLKRESRNPFGTDPALVTAWYGEDRPVHPDMLDAVARFLERHLGRPGPGRCRAQDALTVDASDIDGLIAWANGKQLKPPSDWRTLPSFRLARAWAEQSGQPNPDGAIEGVLQHIQGEMRRSPHAPKMKRLKTLRDQIMAAQPEFLREAVPKLKSYLPADTPLSGRILLSAFLPPYAFAWGDDRIVVSLSSAFFAFDRDRVLHLILHELFHNGMAAHQKSPATEPGANAALEDLLWQTQNEGLATYVAYRHRPPGLRLKDYDRLEDASSVQTAFQHLRSLLAQARRTNNRADPAAAAEAWRLGVEARAFYVAGAHMARSIENQLGRPVLVQTIRDGPRSFFERYAETGPADALRVSLPDDPPKPPRTPPK